MKEALWALMGLVLVLTVPALAMAEATPYASIRFKTMYVDVDVDGGPDTADLEWGLQGNTRVGVDFKVSNAVGGEVELGLEDASDGNTVSLRTAYGVYDFGPGNMLVGQDYAPWDWGAPQRGKDDNDLAGYGSLAVDRSPQITVRLDRGFYATLIQNPNDNADADEIERPILGLGFDGTVGASVVGAGAGYGTWDNGTDEVDTWFLYGQVEHVLGRVKVAAKLYYGQNLGDITASAGSFAGGEDTRTVAGFLAMESRVTNKVDVVAGVGYQTNDNDSYAQDDDQLTYYVDVPVTIHKGFRVIPSVSVFDGLDRSSGGEDDKEMYVGAQWRFDM